MPNEPISEFDKHEGDDDWYSEGEELYEEILDQLREDFPDVIDQHAADVLYDAWFNPDTDRFERAELQWEFFDYTDLDWDDFDWDAWREWYES